MSNELFLSIIGTIIALSAAATTIWQGLLTRRHNRLSVKPLLRIDKITVMGQKASIILANRGVGPATISSVKFLVDGIVIEQSKIKTGFSALKKMGLDSQKYKIFEILHQESFSAGEQMALFESHDKIINEIEGLMIEKSFDRLSMEIEYESIYEEKFKKIM